MARKKKKTKPTDVLSLYQTIRRGWNGVNPVTRTIPDKRRNPPKHKHKMEEIDGD